MSKQELIDAICRHNRSAMPEFLQGFDQQSLQSYLQRLTQLAGHRGRQSIWVRQGPTPCMMTRAH